MKVLIDDYVLYMLWKEYPKGAAKNAMSEVEMRGHISRWRREGKEGV